MERERFIPSRGLRWGCPLSSYLFVLCMESLAHGISQAIRKGVWKPFKFCKNGPILTHLFFADDLLLFGEAELMTAESILHVLEDFCDSSGFCDAMEKSIRRFLWGHNQRLSKVAWNKVNRPKGDGGLGLRNLHAVNRAFGMKACWGLFNNPNSLWGTKYKFEPRSGFGPIAPAVCTQFWRLVCSTCGRGYCGVWGRVIQYNFGTIDGESPLSAVGT
ncbi:uncharacterized protein LOC121771052 [Salvia splendens]|uniref:uncharacterized protein LOC121771052 n=1 Tax=Salvia splendens TaxID=180675 RepID=UPI001C2809AD|nr:uncharacterized protein LOC121771052 [Salvia splendens]